MITFKPPPYGINFVDEKPAAARKVPPLQPRPERQDDEETLQRRFDQAASRREEP